MAGGGPFPLEKGKGPPPCTPPSPKGNRFFAVLFGDGGELCGDCTVGENARIGGGCLSAACAFRLGRAFAEKNAPTRRWFFAQGKPRTAPHCMKTACAFRVGPRIYRKDRACAAMDFRARPGGKAKAYWRYVEPQTTQHCVKRQADQARDFWQLLVGARRLSQKGGLPQRSPASLSSPRSFPVMQSGRVSFRPAPFFRRV